MIINSTMHLAVAHWFVVAPSIGLDQDINRGDDVSFPSLQSAGRLSTDPDKISTGAILWDFLAQMVLQSTIGCM